MWPFGRSPRTCLPPCTRVSLVLSSNCVEDLHHGQPPPHQKRHSCSLLPTSSAKENLPLLCRPPPLKPRSQLSSHAHHRACSLSSASAFLAPSTLLPPTRPPAFAPFIRCLVTPCKPRMREQRKACEQGRERRESDGGWKGGRAGEEGWEAGDTNLRFLGYRGCGVLVTLFLLSR